jgi:hypothetical protein
MYTGKNQSQVKNQTWGITCKWQESERAHLELEKQYRANIHLNISWFELKSRVTSDFDRQGLSGGLRPVPKKKWVSYKTLCRLMAHNGSALDPTMDLHRAMIPNSFQLSFSMTFACATEIQFSFVIWSSWKFWSWIDCSVHCQINL